MQSQTRVSGKERGNSVNAKRPTGSTSHGFACLAVVLLEVTCPGLTDP